MFHLVSVNVIYIRYTSKKNLIKIDCAVFLIRNVPHIYGLPLDLCGKRIAALFAKRTAIFANRPCFHGKSAAIQGQGLRRFTRRRTFRDSVRVQHTQRDKRSARYAMLISATLACLLHSF